VKIGDKAGMRKRFKGEEGGVSGERGIDVGGTVKNHKSDEGGGFGAGEEREGRSGSVEKTDRGVCKDGMAVGSEERGDADERVGQSRVREEVARDRIDFVRKRKFAGDVGGPPTDKIERSGKVKGKQGKGLGEKKGRREGKLHNWKSTPVQPVSTIRGEGREGGGVIAETDGW
jgi:hypothetical protein